MRQFYRLMAVVLISGTAAGLFLFAVQSFTVVPLIEHAERFEQTGGEGHEHDEWRPAEGWERAGFTAVTTVLSAIGFAAILFGFLALTGNQINTRQGALWGLAGFLCFHLAPALGLPPVPPGAVQADVEQRRLWWALTVVATALGLWLIVGRRYTPLRRSLGCLFLAAPHIIGAPAGSGHSAVPPELIQRFTILSLATSALFWPLLGAIGGRLGASDTMGRRSHD
jgi:cobalt transporter subunit CbtA